MKIIVIFILIGISGNVVAEWSYITTTPGDEHAAIYADYSTIKKSGNIVKMWEMWDFKKTQIAESRNYLSVKMLDEFDCENETQKLLAYSEHSKNMGYGDVVRSDGDAGKISKSEYVPPGSIGKGLLEIACVKK